MRGLSRLSDISGRLVTNPLAPVRLSSRQAFPKREGGMAEYRGFFHVSSTDGGLKSAPRQARSLSLSKTANPAQCESPAFDGLGKCDGSPDYLKPGVLIIRIAPKYPKGHWHPISEVEALRRCLRHLVVQGEAGVTMAGKVWKIDEHFAEGIAYLPRRVPTAPFPEALRNVKTLLRERRTVKSHKLFILLFGVNGFLILGLLSYAAIIGLLTGNYIALFFIGMIFVSTLCIPFLTINIWGLFIYKKYRTIFIIVIISSVIWIIMSLWSFINWASNGFPFP